MKIFHYNTVVDRDDFADREPDIQFLSEKIRKGRKVVLYAPRRYGKTSLAQNILPSSFKSKKTACFYVDFMDCTNLDSVCERLVEAYAITLRNHFKASNILRLAKSFLKGLSISTTPDPMTGEISFEIVSRRGGLPKLSEILSSISSLCAEKPSLLVFDDFQDIYAIPEALSVFRSHLQSLKTTPMLFLGSKRKLLSSIFSSQESPFFGFADEHALHPISLKDWKVFFAERLTPVKTRITDEALTLLCEEALDVPNTICEFGAFIQDYYRQSAVDTIKLKHILSDLIDRKSESYRYQLSLLSTSETQFCKALAQNRFSKEINGNAFSKLSKLGPSTSSRIAKKLYHAGVIEEESRGFRLSNPVLSLFLRNRMY